MGDHKRRTKRWTSLLLGITIALPVWGLTTTNWVQANEIQHHWAAEVLSKWQSKGYIRGFKDGSLKPDENVTRAQLAALINKSFGFTKTADIAYKDVHSSNWFYNDIAIARAEGYMKGYNNSTFQPNQKITRQELAVVLTSIKQLKTSDSANQMKDTINSPAWSRLAIGAVIDSHLMKGDNILFRPLDTTTRAEAVTVLERSLQPLTIPALLPPLITLYNTPGIYGPVSGQQQITGDVQIDLAGITLRNIVIEGDLILGESIGKGAITLDHVTVKGKTIINGGHIIYLDQVPSAITNTRKDNSKKKKSSASVVNEQPVQRIEVSNGQVSLHLNQPTHELLLSDMDIKATVDRTAYTLTNVRYDQATGVVKFNPILNQEHYAKVLEITIAPSAQSQRLLTTLQGSLRINGVEKQTTNDINIVLTWGEFPYDEDAHLLGPTPEGYTFHTNTSDREYNYKGENYARLDLDDTHSYGPEIMSIRKRVNGTYTFYVENFSLFPVPTLRHSSATVQVYQSNSNLPIKTYHIPVGDGEESYWYVFDMNIDGDQISFVDQNKLTDTPPSSKYSAPVEDMLYLQKELESILTYTVLPYNTEIKQEISLRKSASNRQEVYSYISNIELVPQQENGNQVSVTKDTYLATYGPTAKDSIEMIKYNGSPYSAQYDVTLHLVLGEAKVETVVRVELPNVDTWLNQAATQAQKVIENSSAQQDMTTLQNALDRKKALTSSSKIDKKITILEDLKRALSSF